MRLIFSRRDDWQETDLYPAHIVWLMAVAGVFLGFSVCAVILGIS